jgi:tetratricopeptide (TPR) repeat protein
LIFDALGEYEKEREALERTRELADRIGDESWLAITLAHLGDHAFFTGAWGAAREYYERAQALMRRVEPWRWSALPAAILSVIAFAQGKWDTGYRYLEEVRGQDKRVEELIVWPEGALAERDLLAGRAQEALSRLTVLLEDRLRSNPIFHELQALLGCILAHAGNLAQGETLADEVVVLTRSHSMRPALAEALRYRAWIATLQDQLDMAESALDESLSLARHMPRPYSEAKALYIYGLLHVHRGHVDRARERFQAALAICERLGERLYAEHVKSELASLTD